MNYKILKNTRLGQKMTILKLAEKTGIHRETLSKIERGINNTDVKTLEKICSIFNLKVNISKEA